MSELDYIKSVSAATISCELPEPIVFGDWIMERRESVVVRMSSNSGMNGWAFTLTRGGAVAEQIRKSIANLYVGRPVGAQESLFELAWRSNLACHSSGVGLRALSLLDLAAWDLAAKSADKSIAELLGGENRSMPATAIVGYPPASTGPSEISTQATDLYNEGWRRFKMAVSANHDATRERLRAVRSVAKDSWIGLDGAWTFGSLDEAVSFALSISDVGLGWFEDVFPPDSATIVGELRRRIPIPVAMGDEQGGPYFPEALLAADAVDVVRVDLTCMGGITRGRNLVEQCQRAGVAFAPHMNAHIHSQVFSGLGHDYVPIEWGIPWTGVDPFADSLPQPVIADGGLMRPLQSAPGFGKLIDIDWVNTQEFDDPDHIFD